MRPCIRCRWAQSNGYSEDSDMHKWMCRHPEAEIHTDEHIDPVRGTAYGQIPTCMKMRWEGPCHLAGWLFEEREREPRRPYTGCPSYPEM